MTVIDKSDPDWWKGKCLGRLGYFPSKYCTKLAGSEKPLQVTHNLQVSDGERGEMTLLRDQIVIQVSQKDFLYYTFCFPRGVRGENGKTFIFLSVFFHSMPKLFDIELNLTLSPLMAVSFRAINYSVNLLTYK